MMILIIFVVVLPGSIFDFSNYFETVNTRRRPRVGRDAQRIVRRRQL